VFNPVSRLRDYIAASGDNLARNAMFIAMLYLVILAIGSYVAARGAGITRWFAVAGALFVTFNVHLLYWDASSWTPALIGMAWFSWFVAAVWWTRRSLRWLPALPIAGFMLVTAGWPHAMIAGGVVALGVGIEQLVTKKWGFKQASLYAAACFSTALLSAPTWIAAKVLADWAARAPHGIFNDGFLTHNFDAVLSSFSPFVQPYIDGFGGAGFMFEPITYIAWFIPLSIYWLMTVERIRKALRADMIMAAVVFIGMFGPSILGPTRWPFRFQPFAAFLVAMVAMHALSLATNESDSSLRFNKVWKWVAPLMWLTFTAMRPRLIPMVLTALLLVAIPVVHKMFVARRLALVSLILGASVVLTTGYLAAASPDPAMPGDRNAPALRSDFDAQYASLNHQRVFVLQSDLAAAKSIGTKNGRFILIPNPEGSVTAADMADGNMLLASNLDTEFVTGYSAMPHRALETLFNTHVFGWTDNTTAGTLFSVEPKTHERWITLLGITAVLVEKGDQQDWFTQAATAAGATEWTISHQTDAWALYTNSKSSTTTPQLITARGDGWAVVARPLVPGMTFTVNGKPAPFTSLNGVVAMVKVPADYTGNNIAVNYEFPRKKATELFIAVGLVLLIAIAILTRRRFKIVRD